MKKTLTSLMFAAMAVASFAQPVVDGTAEGLYGNPIIVQDTETQFGNASIALIDYADGSEIDAAYAYVKGGYLYLVMAGNVESNYNKLELFFDTKSGGQNQLRGDNADVDFNGLNRMAGLRFDTGFDADYWMSFAGGYDGNGYRFFINYGELWTNGGGPGYYVGSGTIADAGVLGGANNPFNIMVAMNNSNTGGVPGGTGVSNGSGVVTGVEYKIPLAAIGATGDVKICAFINGGGHDYLSNQVLAGVGGGFNYGEPAFVDFNFANGDQFFTVSQGSYAYTEIVTTTIGTDFSGDLASLTTSDDAAYCILSDDATLQGEIEFSGFLSNAAPSKLEFVVEQSVGRPGLSYQIDFLKTNATYQSITGGVAPTADSIVYAVAATPSQFIGAGNFVGARINWAPVNDEDPSQDGWLLCVDVAHWIY